MQVGEELGAGAAAVRVGGVVELLETDAQSPEAVGSVPAGGRGHLVFENVSFSYSTDKPLISDLSLVAKGLRFNAVAP
ncbi:ABC transporter protein, partial [Arthrobacter sp. Hiyo6]